MIKAITGYMGRYGNLGQYTDLSQYNNAARYGANAADNASFYSPPVSNYNDSLNKAFGTKNKDYTPEIKEHTSKFSDLKSDPVFKDLNNLINKAFGTTDKNYISGNKELISDPDLEKKVVTMDNFQSLDSTANPDMSSTKKEDSRPAKLFIPDISKLKVLQGCSLGFAQRSMDYYDSFDKDKKSISTADAGYDFLGIRKNGDTDTAAYVTFMRLKAIIYGNDKSYADVNQDNVIDNKDRVEIKNRLDKNQDGIIDDNEAAKVGNIFDLNNDGRVSTGEKAADFIATDAIKGQNFQNGLLDQEKEQIMKCFRSAEIVNSPNYKYENWTKEMSKEAYDFYKLGKAEKNFVMPERKYKKGFEPNPNPKEI
jgi:hypothetical protein